jgi:hypothetical protein
LRGTVNILLDLDANKGRGRVAGTLRARIVEADVDARTDAVYPDVEGIHTDAHGGAASNEEPRRGKPIGFNARSDR